MLDHNHVPMKQYRQLQGMTQKELSEKTGISLRTIQNYEQGKNDIKKAAGETLLILAKALNCSIEDLLQP